MKPDILIVGAGYAGAVTAERMAAAGNKVLIIDKRPHIGGNSYDCLDNDGVLIHPYGPHIFHTNLQNVVGYLSRFTEWRPYEHRVLASVDGQLYPIPINRTTINKLYNLNLDDKGVEEFYEKVREPRHPVMTSEDVVIGTVGRDLYEKFFKNYTRKQWDLYPSQLDASVTRRIPVRINDDDRYFDDMFQKMPRDGYTAMFQKILDHPNIAIKSNTDFFDIRENIEVKHIVYTGPIDAFYNYRFGEIPYRSLRLEHEHISGKKIFQSVATVNYPNDYDYTRITEFKHITGQKHSGTSILKEYPMASGDPYYPVPNKENADLYEKYKALAIKEQNVTFVGRLAEYRYYNMDQTVDTALKAADGILKWLR